MKLRSKLLLAFGVFILLSLLGGGYSFHELGVIVRRMQLVEQANEIEKLFLDTRLFEKNYLLYRDQAHYEELEHHLLRLREDLETIRAEITREIGSEEYGSLREDIERYEALIGAIAEGQSQREQLVSSFIEFGDALEAELGADDLQAFLLLRGEEKNLLLYRSEQAFGSFQETFAALKKRLPRKLSAYGSLAVRVNAHFLREERQIEELRVVARQIESFTRELSARERDKIAKTFRSQKNQLLVILLAAAVIGTAVNLRFSSSITAPLRELERITNKIAQTDFSESIEPKGNDEIASLGRSFNEMAQKLRDTLVSLELAIDNIHEKHEALVEAEKLASLGRLAAGVAHEINNPLAIINEKAGLMDDLIQIDPSCHEAQRLRQLIQGITTSVARCRGITHRLLGAARRTDVTMASLDLNAAVREVSEFLEKEVLFKGIRYELHLAENLPPLWNDKDQLEQVMLNIIKNAIDAVSAGGQIIVSTEARSEETLTVTVRDDGPGIPAGKMKNIFEPFFTTKERGRGTGLGLFVSYAIMKKLGGSISVWSEDGTGTTFVIEIPVGRAA